MNKRISSRKLIRKPTKLSTSDEEVYANINQGDDCLIYIGAPYYDSHEQIHLKTVEQVEKLGKYLVKAAAWLKTKN